MLENLENFHFIRPAWLLGLPLAGLLFWWLNRRASGAARWRRMIAPHLLEHLIVGRRSQRGLTPFALTAAVMSIALIAAAGPTWRREVPPFASDKAPLVIAIDTSRSMLRGDIQPSRLMRAKQKIRDLLDLRQGARTGLIAYAGTAHMVLPLTDDLKLIRSFVDALHPTIMPTAGKIPKAALVLANRMLAEEPVPGSILIVADGVPSDQAGALVTLGQKGPHALLVLAVANRNTRSPNGFAELEKSNGPPVVYVSLDDTDVKSLNRRIQTRYQKVQEQKLGTQWRDYGYYLLFPVVLLTLLWFRKGWTIRWVGAMLLASVVFDGGAARAEVSWYAELLLTPDQQGRLLLERGRYEAAAQRFEDPIWAGIAWYKAKRYDRAIRQFKLVDSTASAFNLGNALARKGDLANAIAAYRRTLELEPGHQGAQKNLALVTKLLEVRRKDEEKNTGPPNQRPDEIKISKKKSRGGERFRSNEGLSIDAAAAWMRQVQTTPRDFLKIRFATEAAKRQMPQRKHPK